MKKFYTAKELKEKMAAALEAFEIEQKAYPNMLHNPVIFNKSEWLFDGRKYHAMHYCSACGAVLINVWTEGEEDDGNGKRNDWQNY